MLPHVQWLGKGACMCAEGCWAAEGKPVLCGRFVRGPAPSRPFCLAVHTPREVWSPPASQLTCLASLPQTPPSGAMLLGSKRVEKWGTGPVSSLCVCIFKKIKFFTVLAYKTV